MSKSKNFKKSENKFFENGKNKNLDSRECVIAGWLQTFEKKM